MLPLRAAAPLGKTLAPEKAERRFNLHTADYARLAAFRQGLREFLRFSEEAAERAGALSQHYQAMLILRACPEGLTVTINDLARQLLISTTAPSGSSTAS
jgi:hypothetical protein